MPGRKKAPHKTEVVAVRLTPQLKRILEQLAYKEGLDLSAWIRNLLIKELKSRGILPEIAITVPPGLERLMKADED